MTFRALIIPGIQSTPEDWEPLKQKLEGIIDLELVDEQDHISPVGLEAEEWMQRTIDTESMIVRDRCCDLLIAHSFGTHRAPAILEQNPQLLGGILLTPARNKMKNADTTFSTHLEQKGNGASIMRNHPEELMEAMMWPVTVDMSDVDFYNFTQRHRETYSKKIVSRKLKFLEQGKPFSSHLEEYKGQAPLLIMQGEIDPWHTHERLEHPRAQTLNLTDTSHYPHLSRPNALSQIMREWLALILTDHQTSSVQTHAEHEGVAV